MLSNVRFLTGALALTMKIWLLMAAGGSFA